MTRVRVRVGVFLFSLGFRGFGRRGLGFRGFGFWGFGFRGLVFRGLGQRRQDFKFGE